MQVRDDVCSVDTQRHADKGDANGNNSGMPVGEGICRVVDEDDGLDEGAEEEDARRVA